MPTKTTTKVAKKENRIKRVRNILVSQPKPERSPYLDIESKLNVTIEWFPLINIEGYSEKEFRRQRIRHDDYPSVVFTSKNAIENYFRLAEEMRFKFSEANKYFCATEAIANYLQKFIIFRKRKVFNGTKSVTELGNYFTKHKESGPFLIPCSESGNQDVASFLKSLKIKFHETPMYRRVSSDLSEINLMNFDMIVLFSQQEVKSIFDNYPDFKQGDMRIAAFGSVVANAVEEAGLVVDIFAPTLETPSMNMAIEEYIKKANKQ